MGLHLICDAPTMSLSDAILATWHAHRRLRNRAHTLSKRWPRSKRIKELEGESERMRELWRTLVNLKLARMP